MKWPIRSLVEGESVDSVTPEACRIMCAPYAYMGKVLAKNSVTSADIPGGAEFSYFRYRWFCSRVFVIQNCIVGPESITLGPDQKCYRSYRWGRITRNAGNLESARHSNTFPDYIHCFKFDPEKVFERTKADYFDFSPYLVGEGSCYRKPQDENLGSIFGEMKNKLPQSGQSGALTGTLLFYYETWAGTITWRGPKVGGVKPPMQFIRTPGEGSRDYWLTVFFL